MERHTPFFKGYKPGFYFKALKNEKVRPEVKVALDKVLKMHGEALHKLRDK